MKLKFILGCLSFLLLSCSQSVFDDELLNVEGITFKDIGNNRSVIDTYTVTKVPTTTMDKLKICIASTINNSSITLVDNSGSYFGAYSGFYYENNNTVIIPPQNTIIAESSNNIVVNGLSEYYSDGRLSNAHYVRYILTISLHKNDINYLFTKIEQANKYTGLAPNTGFKAVGTWSSEEPMKIIETMNNEVNGIMQCITE